MDRSGLGSRASRAVFIFWRAGLVEEHFCIGQGHAVFLPFPRFLFTSHIKANTQPRASLITRHDKECSISLPLTYPWL